MAVHAELNAILQCASIERARTLYCSCTPCFECAKVILNTNITRVVVREPYPSIGHVLLADKLFIYSRKDDGIVPVS